MLYIQVIWIVNGINRLVIRNFPWLANVCLVLYQLSQNRLNICSFAPAKMLHRPTFGNLTTKISFDLKKNNGNEEQA